MTFDRLYQTLQDIDQAPWRDALQPILKHVLDPNTHGDINRWNEALTLLPNTAPSQTNLDQNSITFGQKSDLSEQQWQDLKQQLMAFHPWRKGPLNVFGHEINTEWHSDWKWARAAPHIHCQDKTILDVGCGNGYYCFRMAGQGAKLALGIDPTLVFNMQYSAVKRYAPDAPAYVIPLGIEQLPEAVTGFDMVFSMGVFYHRKSPIEHLMELRQRLSPGGELVLETLIVDGPEHHCLVPKDRYAQMRNVWFLPSIKTLEAWMARCKYRDIKVIDVATTTIEEQRTTEWMHFQSLKDFLDEEDPSKTIEGYPAPKRVVIIAKAPA